MFTRLFGLFNYFREIGEASMTHLPILYLSLQKVRVEAEKMRKHFGVARYLELIKKLPYFSGYLSLDNQSLEWQ